MNQTTELKPHHLVPCSYCGGPTCLYLMARKECVCPHDGWSPYSGHFVCVRCQNGWPKGEAVAR